MRQFVQLTLEPMVAVTLEGARVAEPRDCPAILAQTASVVEPLLRSRVNALSVELRHLCGVHFGWWTDEGTVIETPSSCKLLRPALTLLACQAVGGSVQVAGPAAAAVELVHNASLVHDDLIDQDPVRRGRPALWAAKGMPAAILAGDALLFAAVQALADAPQPERTVPILLTAVQTLLGSEYLDILLEAGADVGEQHVLAVAAGKTGELLACACELGAMAGGASAERAVHLRAFGRHLGIAFQCVDDLLSIWGAEQVTGKPALSDLRQRKVSVPVAAAMAGCTTQARQLRDLYRSSAPLSENDCHRAVALMDQTDAQKVTERRAQRHVADALEHLALAEPVSVAASELASLAQLVTHRDR